MFYKEEGSQSFENWNTDEPLRAEFPTFSSREHSEIPTLPKVVEVEMTEDSQKFFESSQNFHHPAISVERALKPMKRELIG